METLTERQLEILRYIARTGEERGFPPTIREIGGEFNIRSTNGVNDHLKALERKGYLQRGEQKSRSLVPTKSARMLLGMGGAPGRTAMLDIPLLGRVAAGAPLLAVESPEESVAVDPALLPGSGSDLRDLFALKVRGESMIGDGILDGDVVFVRRQSTARSGDMVVALIEGEATVKRFYPEGERIRLQPSNPKMLPIYVAASEARSTWIAGVVIGVFRSIARH